jgi:hypothetical protein
VTSPRLPPAARGRLDSLASGAPWSSQQGVGQEAALRRLGFTPVGVVIASTYSYAFPYRPPAGYLSVSSLSGTLNNAWRDDPMSARRSGGYVHDWSVGPDGKPTMDMGWTFERVIHQDRQRRIAEQALSQLRTEALGVGAHGVVGLQLVVRRFGWDPQTDYPVFEVSLQGTGVVATGQPPTDDPFTSGLSGGELFKLAQHGYAPERFVIGIGAVRGALGLTSRRRLHSANNGEVHQFSEVTEQSVIIARHDLEKQAGAEGDLVVAGRPELDVEHERGVAYEVTTRITGSVIRRFRRSTAPGPLAFMPVVSNNDGAASG